MWRCATFRSILVVVAPRDQQPGPPGGEQDGNPGEEAPDAKAGGSPPTPWAQNRAKVEESILALLRDVTESELHDEILTRVTEITKLAGELALEAGVHRAFLGLSVPDRGDVVEMGPDFVDCEDGDAARGEVETVELVVRPRLFCIGDGLDDVATERSIHAGEIYPARGQDGSGAAAS